MAIQGLPKALLVDLDDTILAFDSVAGACWQRICNRFNSQLDIDSPQKLFSAIMSERSWFWSDPERHYCPARRADFVFARSQLLDMCLKESLPSRELRDFFDVLDYLKNRVNGRKA